MSCSASQSRSSYYDHQYGSRAEKHAPRSIFSMTPLAPVVQKHLQRVYSALCGALVAATAGCALQIYTGIFRGGLVPLFGSLALLFWFYSLPQYGAPLKRRLIFGGIAFLQGWALGPLVDLALGVGGSSLVLAALGATAGIFAGLAGASMFAKRRQYLYLGGFLMGGLHALWWVSFFSRTETGFNILVYGGLALFCGFVLYDSQMIIEKAHDGERDELAHALLLFQDLLAIFRRILVIMIKNKVKRDREQQRRRGDE